MASFRVALLLGIALISSIASTQAQLAQVLAVAGDTVNKAAESATTPQVPKNFVKPKQITSYGQYLKYAGQAAGILPIQPEADSPSGAPGPAADSALAPAMAMADSALAPATAMAGMGQPSLQAGGKGFEQNFDPTIQDWQKAYKPVDNALNKMFETRITNNNARQVQFELAVAAAPLQMLINDQVIKQGDEAKSFVSGLFGSFSGLSGSKKDASDANTIAANPLTGTALTAPTAAAPAPTAVQGSTVTVANPTTTAATASAPAADTTTVAASATAPAAAPAGAVSAARTSTLASQASQNPLASLFSLPSFGKRKLLAAARP